ncbi:MAG TPA: hypothetical protein VHL77_12665, partial [Ferruginibacter sp.]|nr:hypothetical protein [Ferruginibacter sp.]
MSFYYWKTNFNLNDKEKQALAYNNVKTLYVHYCDVGFSEEKKEAYPISTLGSVSSIHDYDIVPVIFIENLCFERLDAKGVKDLAKSIFTEVNFINSLSEITTGEIQFDCDWTERSKDKYFLFLKEYKDLSKQTVSCTIRLHQVKYPERTGVPPVDRGTLMYYNMGAINAGPENSIYEKSVASKYNSF